MNSNTQDYREPYNARLHYFAIIAAIAAVLLILAGAMVTSTHSGDSVPDWPLAYGSLAPPMVGGIAFEYSHRLVAGFTSILIGILAIWLWIAKPRRKIRWLGLAAFVGVLAQAVLGGIRVLVVNSQALRESLGFLTGTTNFDVDRLVFATAHGILAQTILCLLFAIALFLSESWLKTDIAGSTPRPGSGIRWAAIILMAFTFVQLVLGTLIRHTGASLIIPDFPLSFGKIIPPFGSLPSFSSGGISASRSDLIFMVALQFSHRVMAVVILGIVVYLFAAGRKAFRGGKAIRYLLYLTIVQIALGALNIWGSLSVFTTVPHVVVGATILGTSTILVLWSWRSRAAVTSVVSTTPKRSEDAAAATA